MPRSGGSPGDPGHGAGRMSNYIIDTARLWDGLDEQIRQRLGIFARLLRQANERVNLTRISTDEGIRVRHFCDSLAGLDLVLNAAHEDCRQVVIADIGSGAGFPGLVLAIAAPRVRVVSVEATGKKVRFQERVVRELGLDNVELVQGRAEDVGRDADFRGKFDAVTARAVADAAVLAEVGMPLLRVTGRLLMWKGPGEDMAAADRAVDVIGGKRVAEQFYHLENAGERMRIIVYEKTRPTSGEYPRSWSVIKRKPLGK